jgi:hypothetical protein
MLNNTLPDKVRTLPDLSEVYYAQEELNFPTYWRFAMRTKDEPTLEWTIHHVTDYLDGRIDIKDFWEPFPEILAFYLDHDYPEEPSHRLAYFWRRNSFNVRSIVQSGHTDMEAGSSSELTQCKE